jgi:hypothetical protein
MFVLGAAGIPLGLSSLCVRERHWPLALLAVALSAFPFVYRLLVLQLRGL